MPVDVGEIADYVARVIAREQRIDASLSYVETNVPDGALKGRVVDALNAARQAERQAAIANLTATLPPEE